MSITIESLKNKRKQELKDIAQDLGLNTKGLRWELENRIRTHLIENQHEEESIVDGAPSNSPTRRPSRKLSTGSRTKSRKPRSSPNGEGSRASEEESDTSDVDKQEVTVNARYQASANSTEEVIVQRGLPRESTIGFDAFHNYILRLRKDYSNTRTFLQCVVFSELAVFLYCAIEWNLKIATVPIPAFAKTGKDFYDIHGPDIFVIFEWHRFWRPLISFFIYLLLIPLGFSYVFNLDPQRHSLSPLAFSVAQCGIFLATGGHFDWVEDVRDFIPENLIYAGSGAGIIFSLYESILTI